MIDIFNKYGYDDDLFKDSIILNITTIIIKFSKNLKEKLTSKKDAYDSYSIFNFTYKDLIDETPTLEKDIKNIRDQYNEINGINYNLYSSAQIKDKLNDIKKLILKDEGDIINNDNILKEKIIEHFKLYDNLPLENKRVKDVDNIIK